MVINNNDSISSYSHLNNSLTYILKYVILFLFILFLCFFLIPNHSNLNLSAYCDDGSKSTFQLNAILKDNKNIKQPINYVIYNIEEALNQDEYDSFDLAAMAREYVANSNLKHGSRRFKYVGPNSGIYVLGSDLRIAQLLLN